MLTNEAPTMSSREIATLCGKEHSNVLRDIRVMLINLYGDEYVRETIPERYRNRHSEYIRENADHILAVITGHSNWNDEQNQTFRGYKWQRDNRGYITDIHLDKNHTLTLISGYNAKLRMAIIKRWQELENQQPKLPQTFAQALKLAYEQQLLIEQQQAQITEMKPKADYCDIILQSKGLVTVTQMAKDYGMSGIKFNQVLADLKIQYKQSGQWQLYQVYADKGYTQSTTHPITHKDGTVTTRLNTKWTQQGRLFLYNKLKEHGILPLIERNPQKQLTI